MAAYLLLGIIIVGLVFYIIVSVVSIRKSKSELEKMFK
jgi:hypothetical protein